MLAARITSPLSCHFRLGKQIRNEHPSQAGHQARPMAVDASALDAPAASSREGGSHAENTGGLTVLLVQPRTGPNRAGIGGEDEQDRDWAWLAAPRLTMPQQTTLVP